MAHLKDLIVSGVSRFVGKVFLSADPTSDYEAATKHYVDNKKAANATKADSATTATTADKLTGFSSRSTTMAWGNQTGSVVTCFADSAGGGWGFRSNNPTNGQTSQVIDGTIYIKEGAVNVGDAIKTITRSGTTYTYTTLWGNTGTFTQQDNNTTYSAGAGLALSGTTFKSNVPRVAEAANTLPGINTWTFKEYTSGANYNLPSTHWYYILTCQGSDANYGAELALGMTVDAAYYRVYNNKTWGSWHSIIDTNTTYSSQAAANGGTAVSLVTTGEKYTWNNKASTAVATTSANGLMSSTDKTKVNNTNVYFGTCDTAAATAAKVVTLTNATGFSLAAGAIVGVKFTYTNTASSVTLNVNSSGAKSIYYNTAVYTSTSSEICGSANQVIYYMYDGTNWVFINRSGNYTNSNTYDRTYLNSAVIKAKSAITSGNIIVGTADGTYQHLKAGTAFDVTYPILYAGANIAANAASNSNTYFAIPFTVTTTQSITLTASSAIFIKGKLSGTIFTPVSTAPLTQTRPTTADGYQYIYLGQAYNGTTAYLMPEHPIFEYNGSWHEGRAITNTEIDNICK